MRPKVVYILGAGFSAPAGLPVVANFFGRSKDLFADEPKRFEYFQQVFDLVRELHAGKSYYRMDLTNIEEILSLLEMGEFAAEKSARDLFVRYLKDVVQALTHSPDVSRTALTANWRHEFLGRDGVWPSYAMFVASLSRLLFVQAGGIVRRERVLEPPATYSVVSLNYDTVLENAAALLRAATVGVDFGFRIVTTTARGEDSAQYPTLAKIHGSVDDDSIVPPTWNKGGRPGIQAAWREATRVLTEANYLRFVGYSLPDTDAYVRYLLKYAATEAGHFKGIDVICLDPEKTVKTRYASFIEAPLRFADRDASEYLHRALTIGLQSDTPDYPIRPQLEVTHESFMAQYERT